MKNAHQFENIFQSSKVFKKGGPYKDLLNVHPKDAKRDERVKTSGNLTCFKYNNELWKKDPKTMFYDWIYIRLSRDGKLDKVLKDKEGLEKSYLIQTPLFDA